MNNFSVLPVLASEAVRRRPIHYKQLGALLVAEREQRGWQQAEAAAMAQRQGLKALTRQVLLRLENGQTKSPDPEALKAVAALYKLKYADLVQMMVSERYGILGDPSRHGAVGQRTPHQQGDAVDPASAHRIDALERERKELKARLREMHTAAQKFAKIAAAGAEGDEATGTTPRPRRGR